jgi:hypothetical protein
MGAIAIVVFGIASAVVAGSALGGVAAGVALAACLVRFYLPVRCSIDDREAVVRTAFGTRRMSLSSVRRVARDERAMMLSSRSAPSSADVLRGFILPLPAQGADEIVRRATQSVGAARQAASS